MHFLVRLKPERVKMEARILCLKDRGFFSERPFNQGIPSLKETRASLNLVIIAIIDTLFGERGAGNGARL